MKKKTWATIALSAVVALFVGAGVSTVSYPAEEDVVTAAAETPYYEVDSIIMRLSPRALYSITNRRVIT